MLFHFSLPPGFPSVARWEEKGGVPLLRPLTVLLCPSPPSETDSRMVGLRGRRERLGVQSLMGGCPSLSCQGGGEGRLRGGVGSQPFEPTCPILCGPGDSSSNVTAWGQGRGMGRSLNTGHFYSSCETEMNCS